MKDNYKRVLLIKIFLLLLYSTLTFGRPFRVGTSRSCCNRSSIGGISITSNGIINSKDKRRLISGAFININNRTKTQGHFKSTLRNGGCSHHSRDEFELMGVNIDSLFTLPFLTLPWLQKRKKNQNSINDHSRKFAPDIQHKHFRGEKREINQHKNFRQKMDFTMIREDFSSSDNHKVRIKNDTYQIAKNSNTSTQDETQTFIPPLIQTKEISLHSKILQSITKAVRNKKFDLNMDQFHTLETNGNTNINTAATADINGNKRESKENNNGLEKEQTGQSSQSNSKKGPTHIVHNDKNDNDQNEKDKNRDENTTSHDEEVLTSTTLHTYHYPTTNVTLYGLNVSLPKFKAWVAYMLQEHYTINHTNGDTTFDVKNQKKALLMSRNTLDGSKSSVPKPANRDNNFYYKGMAKYISTEEIEIDPKRRSQLRRDWFDGRLISDRTEVLASYPSNQINDSKTNHKNIDGYSDGEIDSTQNDCKHQDVEVKQTKQKRGGFDDLLSVYSDRLVTIVKDELSDKQLKSIEKEKESASKSDEESTVHNEFSETNNKHDDCNTILDGKNLKTNNSSLDLISWLKSEYGSNETSQLMFSSFSKLTEEDQLSSLQHFLHWFKDHFPYYYDRCDECHASFRDDQNNNADEQILQNEEKDEEESEIIDGTFLGYVYPSTEEVEGKASRTELYHCHKCRAYTRFPRFNSISSIVKYGRGRCGEYSILAYRILRDLGHEARWVVDWSDHVWVECWLNHPEKDKGRWIHLDPCEAACDEPHLYQEWGKKQTMIVAFWVPRHENNGVEQNDRLSQRNNIPLIQDVTRKYTSDSLEIIQSRREESNNQIQSSIQEVEVKLRNKLRSLISLEP